jgi:alpha-tubulin suppressor-like RCC1 family protein
VTPGEGIAGWISRDPSVATVSIEGVVKALSTGTTTIVATLGDKSDSASLSVVTVQFASFTAGGAHTCGLTADGIAWCWGRGESGQLGVLLSDLPTVCTFDEGGLPCVSFPLLVQGGLTFTRLVAGATHTCGLTSDGTAFCWGLNQFGWLGDGTTTNRYTPTPVATTRKFTMLAAGAGHTCGLTASGAAYCWGTNGKGQLGDGTTTGALTPVAVTGGHVFATITAGAFSIGHTCGVTIAGKAFCWGDNQEGQLGIGAKDNNPHPTPTAVAGGLEFASLSAGLGQHTCGVSTAGGGYCWGQSVYGAIGDGTDTDRSAPAAVVGGLTFAQITAGGFIGHSCGLTTAGKAYCWGENEVGAVGDGTTVDRLSPAAVAGGFTFTQIDAGFRHTCALATTGILYCWGSGRAGQLGNNSLVARSSPVGVIGQP